jgi:hypothetical protein
MEINSAQFLPKFIENGCYRVAGLVSCVFHESPCVPVIRGDQVPVPMARSSRDRTHGGFDCGANGILDSTTTGQSEKQRYTIQYHILATQFRHAPMGAVPVVSVSSFQCQE